jgi:hypothetical protein
MVEITILPKEFTGTLPMLISGTLFPVRHESLKIRPFRSGCQNEIKMICHEAVRMNFKLERHCALANRQQRRLDYVAADEEWRRRWVQIAAEYRWRPM